VEEFSLSLQAETGTQTWFLLDQNGPGFINVLISLASGPIEISLKGYYGIGNEFDSLF
jgi:hypothetical protein